MGSQGVKGPIVLSYQMYQQTEKELQMYIGDKISKKYSSYDNFIQCSLFDINYTHVKTHNVSVTELQKKEIEKL